MLWSLSPLRYVGADWLTFLVIHLLSIMFTSYLHNCGASTNVWYINNFFFPLFNLPWFGCAYRSACAHWYLILKTYVATTMLTIECKVLIKFEEKVQYPSIMCFQWCMFLVQHLTTHCSSTNISSRIVAESHLCSLRAKVCSPKSGHFELHINLKCKVVRGQSEDSLAFFKWSHTPSQLCWIHWLSQFLHVYYSKLCNAITT